MQPYIFIFKKTKMKTNPTKTVTAYPPISTTTKTTLCSAYTTDMDGMEIDVPNLPPTICPNSSPGTLKIK